MNNNAAMSKYVSCEDCSYKDLCEEFDPFFGCNNGQQNILKNSITLSVKEVVDENIER